MMLLRSDKRHLLVQVSGGQVSDGRRAPIEYNLYLIEDGEVGDDAISLGQVGDGSHMEGFFKYLELLDIQIEEANCAEIAEVFDLMQPNKSLLENLNDLLFRHPSDSVEMEEERRREEKRGVSLRYTDESVVYVDEQKEDIARAYREIIKPPVFSAEGDVRQITFWMVDLATRDLERWEVIEDASGERRVDGEVVEEDLVWSILLTTEDE
jgi:hypothetical protein